jgi:ubiquinone/menaquinone biosynthesis C-methylase UbiE
MELIELQLAIDSIDQISDEDWQRNLNQRKLNELKFHDSLRDTSFQEISTGKTEGDKEIFGNRKYYSTVRRSRNFTQQWIAINTPGLVFLDYACGNGDNTLFAAENGAALSLGFDISQISVQNCKKESEQRGLKNTRFFQADAERTRLPDSSIDIILCSGMLHHLDLSFTFPEMRRILKPGGKVFAIEALDINPLIKLYRKLTPKMRTEWESKHILSIKEVKFAQRFFVLKEIRYWHVIGYVAGKFPYLLRALEKIDTLLEKIPLVRKMAWIFTFELVKVEES